MIWGRPRLRFIDEGGAFIVMWAILIVALMTMVAIVIDLSALREDRRESSLSADFAATAGAFDLDPFFGGNARAACQSAWDYFRANRVDADPVTTAPQCMGAGSPFLTTCDPTIGRSTTGIAGPYTIVITIPVTDSALLSDFTRKNTGQVVNPEVDGDPCARVGVSVSRDRRLSFAPVIGINDSSTATQSVAIGGQGGDDGEPVALLLLEPSGCDALFASGQGGVRVKSTIDDRGTLDTSDDIEKPGVIFVRSDGSTCTMPNSWTIDPKGNNSSIVAEDTPSGIRGILRSFALSGPSASKAYDFADVSSGRLSPTPTPSPSPPTRAPVDHRYNCKNSYPASIGIPGCVNASTRDPHIDELRTKHRGPGSPSGFNLYPDDLVNHADPAIAQPHAACVTQPSTAAITIPAGDWYANCSINFSNTVTFGGGTFVSEGGFALGGGSVDLNSSSTSDTTLFVRNGNLSKAAQAAFKAERTFVLLDNGAIDFGAGSGALNWTAPFAGNFDDLTLWSESASNHQMGGQAALGLEGVFFMPNALFQFDGQAGLNQTKAQFIAKRLEAKGQGFLEMAPDPNRVVLFPLKAVRLIR